MAARPAKIDRTVPTRPSLAVGSLVVSTSVDDSPPLNGRSSWRRPWTPRGRRRPGGRGAEGRVLLNRRAAGQPTEGAGRMNIHGDDQVEDGGQPEVEGEALGPPPPSSRYSSTAAMRLTTSALTMVEMERLIGPFDGGGDPPAGSVGVLDVLEVDDVGVGRDTDGHDEARPHLTGSGPGRPVAPNQATMVHSSMRRRATRPAMATNPARR